MIHSNPRYLFFPVHNSHTKVISKRGLPSIKNFVSGEIILSVILSVSLLGTVILLVTVGNFISQRELTGMVLLQKIFPRLQLETDRPVFL